MLWTHYDLETALTFTNQKGEDWGARGVSIDSRTIQPGELFVPLKGPNFDGHKFIDMAIEKGASGVITEKDVDVNCFVVKDTHKAFIELARFAQQRFMGTRIAITGSVGKTTFKELLSFLIAKQKTVYATEGNLNNHFGVPLSLARLPKDVDVGILELGMNHAGEIRNLTKMVVPDIAVITAISPAHIEFFESTRDIARAKAEIFESVDKGGCAFINADTLHSDVLVNAAYHQGIDHVITYGEAGDMKLISVDGQNASYKIGTRHVDVLLPIPGVHWAMNVLGVFAILRFLGLDLKQAAEDLKSFHVTKGRGQILDVLLNGHAVKVIDDAYNANPDSVCAAMTTLMALEGGRKIAVLADMLELGDDAPEYHTELKDAVIDADLVVTMGQNMRHLHHVLGDDAIHCDDVDSVFDVLSENAQDGDVILVKGSYGAGIWRLIEKF